MDDNIHFKLFLKLEHKEVEVRRFSCEVNTEYGEFRTRVRAAFGQLPDDDFILKWEDEDGDKVAISSDEEFNVALKHLKTMAELFRVDVEIFEHPWWKQVTISKTNHYSHLIVIHCNAQYDFCSS